MKLKRVFCNCFKSFTKWLNKTQNKMILYVLLGNYPFERNHYSTVNIFERFHSTALCFLLKHVLKCNNCSFSVHFKLPQIKFRYKGIYVNSQVLLLILLNQLDSTESWLQIGKSKIWNSSIFWWLTRLQIIWYQPCYPKLALLHYYKLLMEIFSCLHPCRDIMMHHIFH